MKKILLTFLCILLATGVFSQNVLLFQPGPGNNDGTDEGGMNSGKDAMTYQLLDSVNYGANMSIATYPLSVCNAYNFRAFLKFDVSTLPDAVDSVFACFSTEATGSVCNTNCDNRFELRRVISPWDEMTLTWNNMPYIGEAISDEVHIVHPYAGGLVRLNITEAYNKWRNEIIPNHGFIVYPKDGECNLGNVYFSFPSSDNIYDTTQRPYLEIHVSTESAGAPNRLIGAVYAYPNPSGEQSVIRFQARQSGTYQFILRDAVGRIVQQVSIQAEQGRWQHIPIQTSIYPNGTYFFSADGSEDTVRGKLIVQH